MQKALFSIFLFFLIFAGCGENSDIVDGEKVEIKDELFSEFGVGFGATYAFGFAKKDSFEKVWVSSISLINQDDNLKFKDIKNFDEDEFKKIQKSLSTSKFVVYWIPKNWKESWFDINELQKAMDGGLVPVFIYWYFGDFLMNGMPNTLESDEYREDNERLSSFLSKLKGKKLLILEPEFNKKSVLKDEETKLGFAEIIRDAIITIKAKNSDTLFSLAMMDRGRRDVKSVSTCGYENCALGDKKAWVEVDTIYNALLDELDFISFQQMIGQFSRDPNNPGTWESPNPISYKDSKIGIDFLAARVINFSTFLNKRYKKPIFLPYIAIASATWNDNNLNNKIEQIELDKEGWIPKIDKTYKDLLIDKKRLQDAGLFGICAMELFDDPNHDEGGYQFFIDNEYHLGVIATKNNDGAFMPKGSVLDILFPKVR